MFQVSYTKNTLCFLAFLIEWSPCSGQSNPPIHFTFKLSQDRLAGCICEL